MKKAYWVVAYRTVPDETVLKEYGRLAGPAVQAGGGVALARSPEVETREAGLNKRLVIIEFESLEKAVATYESPEYKAALQALGNSAERDFRIIEGI